MVNQAVKVNVGCGPNPPDGWVNVDGSFNALPTKYNFFRKVLYSIGFISRKSFGIKWSKRVVYMNLNGKFKFQDNSVDVIYASLHYWNT